ncbi:MAG: hypothetical protein K9K32_04730 [Halanaerobiales bacterium]|nr:hypothetical protein [Halanaerobiales bacterium]
MSNRLVDVIINNKIKVLSIVGLAKNTGKTVTLNHIIESLFIKSKKTAVLSYGRDGESYDLITGKDKPPVKIYPDTIFITARRAVTKLDFNYRLIKKTDIKTTMGTVNIYISLSEGEVQLVGINRLSQLKSIKKALIDITDYILIDGALNRRSSALPKISDAMILATGAVIGSSIEDVIDKTIFEVEKLMIGNILNTDYLNIIKGFQNKGQSIIWTEDDSIIKFKTLTSIQFLDQVNKYFNLNHKDIKYIFINGALTNTIADKIMNLNINNFLVIITDPTKIFLDKMRYNSFQSNNIYLKTLYPINLIAITINPYNPLKENLDKNIFLKEVKNNFKVPVYNIKG